MDEDSTRNELVMQMLRATEKQHGFKIIFACETGSRSYGLQTAGSDVDVKGLFMYPASGYLSVEKKLSYLKLNHEGKLMGSTTDLDLELVDLRKYMRSRCKITKFDEAVLWLRNPNPYINLLSPALINQLIESQATPLFQIQSKIIKYKQKFEKNLIATEPSIIIVKDVLNSIVQSFQILSVVVASDQETTHRENGTFVSVQAITLNFSESVHALKHAIQKYAIRIKEEEEEEKSGNEKSGKYLQLLRSVEQMHDLANTLFEMKKTSNSARISLSNPILIPYFEFLKMHVLSRPFWDRVPSLELIDECNSLFQSALLHVFSDDS